jgi:hypothetical protein
VPRVGHHRQQPARLQHLQRRFHRLHRRRAARDQALVAVWEVAEVERHDARHAAADHLLQAAVAGRHQVELGDGRARQQRGPEALAGGGEGGLLAVGSGWRLACEAVRLLGLQQSGQKRSQQEAGCWLTPGTKPHLQVKRPDAPAGPHQPRQGQRVVAVAAGGVHRRVSRLQHLVGFGRGVHSGGLMCSKLGLSMAAPLNGYYRHT